MSNGESHVSPAREAGRHVRAGRRRHCCITFCRLEQRAASVPLAVMLPSTPDDVAAVLAICAQSGQPVSIRGGLTDLAGGANPLPGEIVLSLAKLNAIEEVDAIGGTVVVQAGVTLEQLQLHVECLGWFFRSTWARAAAVSWAATLPPTLAAIAFYASE